MQGWNRVHDFIHFYLSCFSEQINATMSNIASCLPPRLFAQSILIWFDYKRFSWISSFESVDCWLCMEPVCCAVCGLCALHTGDDQKLWHHCYVIMCGFSHIFNICWGVQNPVLWARLKPSELMEIVKAVTNSFQNIFSWSCLLYATF